MNVIFAMKERQVIRNIWIYKDWCRASVHRPTELLILICISDLTLFTHVLHDPNLDYFKYKPPDCICASSPFIYNATGHVITGDLIMSNNTSLQDVFAKAHKYREPKEIVKIGIMQHVFVIKNCWCYWYGISIRN
jgi:hypothetical protein